MASTYNDLAVIDLSHHNETPNFEAMREAGVVGVILKATEGGSYIDPTYKDRHAAAIRAGLFVGAYHFMRPGDQWAHMNHFIDTVGPVGPVERFRMVLDHEDEAVPLEDLERAVLYLRELVSVEVAIYSGHLIKQQLGGDCNEVFANHTTLWIAHYTDEDEPEWPRGTWPEWSLWQYTDRGAVPGCIGATDCNRFNGNDVQCAWWMRPLELDDAPMVPAADPDVVEVGYCVPSDQRIRITLNGVVVWDGKAGARSWED